MSSLTSSNCLTISHNVIEDDQEGWNGVGNWALHTGATKGN